MLKFLVYTEVTQDFFPHSFWQCERKFPMKIGWDKLQTNVALFFLDLIKINLLFNHYKDLNLYLEMARAFRKIIII